MRRRARKIALALLGVGLILGIWAVGVEPGTLRVREVALAIPGWPAGRAGMRVALVSDLHVGSPHNGLGKLDEVVARTNAARPDLILILGDLVIHGIPGGRFVPPDQIAPALGRLRAPLGVYAVLGNHDRWIRAPRVINALASAGIPSLEDQAVLIGRGGPPFWLVGVSDYWSGRHDVRGALAQVTSGDPVLLFTHNPDVFPTVPSRVSLTLAGHTHGGQVWLPIFGRLVVPARKRYAIGHVAEGGRHLFVTSGVGMSILPVRFLVPPEIAIVRLRPLAAGRQVKGRPGRRRCP